MEKVNPEQKVYVQILGANYQLSNYESAHSFLLERSLLTCQLVKDYNEYVDVHNSLMDRLCTAFHTRHDAFFENTEGYTDKDVSDYSSYIS